MRFEKDTATSHPLERVLGPGTYYWCRCGKTAMPPYCDGAHAGTGVDPLKFTIDKARAVSVCNCGLSSRPPFCDGQHEEE